MGYPQGTKGFRVWLPDEERCTISRNIIFHEEDSQRTALSREVNEADQKGKGKAVIKEDRKCVSFSPRLIRGPTPSPCEHDSEASTSGSASTEGSVSGGAMSN